MLLCTYIMLIVHSAAVAAGRGRRVAVQCKWLIYNTYVMTAAWYAMSGGDRKRDFARCRRAGAALNLIGQTIDFMLN